MARNFLYELIVSRMSALNLSKYELVIRAGYTNTTKGLRRLEMLEYFDFDASRHLIEGLPEALGVTAAEVEQAIVQSVSDLRSEQEAEWRRDFRPYALVRTGDGGRPRQIFVAALVNAGQYIRTDFAPGTPEVDYVGVAVAAYLKNKQSIRNFFSAPESIVVNYSPDRAAVYSLKGELLEELDSALRPAHLRLTFR